jgi:S1-C subfamily serine protease
MVKNKTTKSGDHSDAIKSTVYVLSDRYVPKVTKPWEVRGTVGTSSGSGFCIEYKGYKMIITNVHVIADSNRVRIRYGTTEFIVAKILYMAYECDLALLTVDSASSGQSAADVATWWAGIKPILADMTFMPNKADQAYVYGYPLGESLSFNVSVSKGIVSRISMSDYMNMYRGIVVQIDASANRGNSGGPVVTETGQLIGVLFSGMDNGLEFVIPIFTVKFFLESYMCNLINQGATTTELITLDFPGIATVGVIYNDTQNKAMRQFCNMPDDMGGIFVDHKKIAYDTDLIDNDVIIGMDGVKISKYGTVQFSAFLHNNNFRETNWYDEQIPIGTYVSTKFVGNDIDCVVWRGEKTHKLKVPLVAHLSSAPYHLQKRQYVILLGMIFLPLSIRLITEKQKNDENVDDLLFASDNIDVISADHQLVCLSDVTDRSFVYETASSNKIVDTINGIKVLNIIHLHDLVEHFVNKKIFIVIKFYSFHRTTIINPFDIIEYDDIIRTTRIGDVPKALL